jgi:hypothetical protein
MVISGPGLDLGLATYANTPIRTDYRYCNVQRVQVVKIQMSLRRINQSNHCQSTARAAARISICMHMYENTTAPPSHPRAARNHRATAWG